MYRVCYSKRLTKFRITAVAIFVFTLSSAVSAQDGEPNIKIVIDPEFAESGKLLISEALEIYNQSTELPININIISEAQSKTFSQVRSWHIAITPTISLANNLDEKAISIASSSIPFLAKDTKQLLGYQESAYGKAALSALSSEGIFGVAYLNAGISTIAAMKEIVSASDLNGLKMGVTGGPKENAFLAYGVSISQIPSPEIGNALTKGAVDVAELFVDPALVNRSELRDLTFLQGARPRVAAVLIEKSEWDKLPFLIRAPLADALEEAARRIADRQQIAESNVNALLSEYGFPTKSFSDEERDGLVLEWINSQPASYLKEYIEAVEAVKFQKKSDAGRNIGHRSEVREIVFVTTRPLTGSGKFRYAFGDDRTGTYICGKIRYEGTESLKNFRAIDIHEKGDCDQFIVDATERKEVNVFVHGYNNFFSAAAARAAKFDAAKPNNAVTMLWSWSSRGEVDDYNYDKESADEARAAFAESIGKLKGKIVNVLAHSMGNYVLMGAMDFLYLGGDRSLISKIIYAAPDVPTDVFRRSIDRAKQMAEKLTLYTCSWDFILELSQVANRFPRAGSGGRGNRTLMDGLDAIEVDGEWVSSNHSYIFDDERVFGDLRRIIGGELDPNRRDLQKIDVADGQFWKFQ